MSENKTHQDIKLIKSGVFITATDSNGEACHIEIEFSSKPLTFFISYNTKNGEIQISDPKFPNRVFTVEYGKKGGLKIKREKSSGGKSIAGKQILLSENCSSARRVPSPNKDP